MNSQQYIQRHPESQDIPLRVASQKLATQLGWKFEKSELKASHDGGLFIAEFFLSYKIPGISFEIGGGDFHDGTKLLNGYARFRMVLLDSDAKDIKESARKLILANRILDNFESLTEKFTLYGMDGKIETNVNNGLIFKVCSKGEDLKGFTESATIEDLYDAYYPVLNVVTKAIDMALIKKDKK
jgi:hypothetical protein